MNYVREINSFYDWLETNSIPDTAIGLWHALMHINNKAAWVTEFAVAISTLSTKTGLKKDAIIRARLRLEQAGRISFKSRSGQQSAIYHIIPFESDKATQTIPMDGSVVLTDANRNTNRAQSATQTEHKPLPLIDLLVQDIKDVTVTPVESNSELIEPQTMADAHRHVFNVNFMPPLHSNFLLPIMKEFGEPYVVELLLEMGEVASKPSIRYLERVHAGWQKDGVKSRSEAKAKKAAEVQEWETQRRTGSAKRGFSQSSGHRKPAMPVVGNEGPASPVPAEERERMRELARKLRDGEPGLSVRRSATGTS